MRMLVRKRCYITLLVVLLFSCFNLQAQKKGTVTVQVQNASLKDIFDAIEKQSTYRFAYQNELLDNRKDITLSKKNVDVTVVLDIALTGRELTYKVVSPKSIVITKKAQRTDSKSVKSVSGTVVDVNGEPIIGASVMVKGTTNGTITDIDGHYLLTVPENCSLEISYIGYTTLTVSSKGKNIINATLTEDAQLLDEVVVVGYGTQKKVNVTGAVSTVSSDKLTVAPLASTTNTLAGRLPGLISKQESGLPGGDNSSLSIRGFGSPLVIVDGVESSFNNIDANEIESVSILKDASAAVYGARAGDGVILITTKRGIVDKPTITLQSSITLQAPTNLPKMASSGQMAELWREAQINAGVPENQLKFTQEDVDKYYAGNDPDYPNTDWWDIVTRKWAPQQQHNLSIRGGSEKIKYYGFLGYTGQETLFKKNGGEYNRYNLRSNIDAKIFDNLTLQIDLSSIIEKRDFPVRGGSDKDYSVWADYWNTEPFWSATLPDPNKIPYAGAGGTIGYHYTSNSELSGYKKTNTQNIKGTISLNYDFKYVKGLSAKAFFNYNQTYSFEKRFSYSSNSYSYNHSNDSYTQQTTGTNPQLTHQDNKSRIITGQFSLNYARDIAKDHHISALALVELIDTYSDWISAQRINYKSTAIDYLFAGGLDDQRADGRASEMGRRSFIGRLNYDYKSKYLLEATIRMDESAKFAKENRKGYFPSVSLAWRISEEYFIKNAIPSLDNLKLRLSYSETGKDDVRNMNNEAISFAYLTGYLHGSSYLMGSSVSTGLVISGMPNSLLTWEKMQIFNGGFDFSFFNRKLYGEFDAFYRDRKGIPGQRHRSLPDTFGAQLPIENLNSINTRGFELIIGTEGRRQNFQWDLSANLSWSRSKWGHYDEPEYDDPDQARIYKKSGQWVDRSYGYISDGVFTSQEEIDALDFIYDTSNGNKALKPGDIRYKQYNDDGLLDWRDMDIIGKGTTPNWMAGMNVNLKYKNFDLSALFQGAFGFYNQIKLRWGNNFSELMYNERWTQENNRKDALIARLGGANTNEASSDFYYKRADYLRLKTLSIGYSLPTSLLKKIQIKQLRIYGAATNVFTLSGLTKYDIDPEAPSGYGGYYYPQMQTVTLGLNLTF